MSQRILGIEISCDETASAVVEDGKLVTFVEGIRIEIIDINEIFIKGMHNLYNSMAAVLVGQLLGVDAASIRSTLKTFQGVEHRAFLIGIHPNDCSDPGATEPRIIGRLSPP